MDQNILQEQLSILVSNSDDQTKIMKQHRRDMFAAQALLGLIPFNASPEEKCARAVEYADLIIKELDK